MTHLGSYDDAPESEVATVLQVPLLWRADAGANTGVRSQGVATGRHRAPAGRHAVGTRSRPKTRAKPTGGTLTVTAAPSGHLRHTIGVGVVSAALVLAVFALALVALALWLP